MSQAEQADARHFDVIIVGAGLSGIGAACHLARECPGKTFTLLEGREASGGTWDLFRYPGIRSDSDMYTLGYSFKPWKDPKAIADGKSILAYVRETAAEHGVDRAIRFQHRVVGARWSSEAATWTLDVDRARAGEGPERVTFTCNFLYGCCGYYDYEAGYTPALPGRDRYRGQVVHPQHWTPDIVWEGKRVVVIGSGATAITLVPELAKKAAHVVMLQRSPTFVVSLPGEDTIANALRAALPDAMAYSLTRLKNVSIGMLFYELARRRPAFTRERLLGLVRRQLGRDYDVQKHFSPRYQPWDERLCVVPDGDLFKAVREGRAEVVTDTIETFTEGGITLASGRTLETDLVVTATGLVLKFLGGIKLVVDGRPVVPRETLNYKGMMFSDVPNLVCTFGYTNASWTLKADLIAAYTCRLLRHMDAIGARQATPRRTDPSVEPEPFVSLTSGYFRRGIDDLPRLGSKTPWKLHQNYVRDVLMLRGSALDDGVMEFRPSARRDGAP
jgi:cation diffusion facilitator CzcD-associated flavoprotein CzcO